MSKHEEILSKYVGNVSDEDILKCRKAVSPENALKAMQEAVDAAFIARTALASEGDGWIRVEDGLPELGSTVLTYPHFKVLPFGNDSDLNHDATDTTFWEWQGDHETGSHIVARPFPTHWRPLPTPPQNSKI